MTSPRIVSSTPAPRRLFPPLPAEVIAEICGTMDPEPPPAPSAPPTLGRPRIALTFQGVPFSDQDLRVLLAYAVIAAVPLVTWALYAALVLGSVRLPGWWF